MPVAALKLVSAIFTSVFCLFKLVLSYVKLSFELFVLVLACSEHAEACLEHAVPRGPLP